MIQDCYTERQCCNAQTAIRLQQQLYRPKDGHTCSYRLDFLSSGIGTSSYIWAAFTALHFHACGSQQM